VLFWMNKSLLVFLTLSLFGTGHAATTLFGPVPYRQRSDSPFYGGIQQGTIYVEDFEDAKLSTPNVSLPVGRPGFFQGVDEDDGVLDQRNVGGVWYNTTAVPGEGAPWTHEILFTPNSEGQYPFWVGFALLGFIRSTIAGDVFEFYQFFDASGNSLTPEPLKMAVFKAPVDTPLLSTIGDRFVGAYSDAGISKVLIGAAPSFDHLQYGYSIPETGSLGLLLIAGAVCGLRRPRIRAAVRIKTAWQEAG
jgi:hypothetical protein